MVKPFARLRISKQRSYETSCPEHMREMNGAYSRGGGTDYDDDQYDDMDDRDRRKLSNIIKQAIIFGSEDIFVQ